MASSSIYRSLDQENGEIRVLVLIFEPDEHLTEVNCYLKHVSLRERPHFNALSYCWGDPTVTKPIYVNGHKIEVTVNLEAALQGLLERAKLAQDRRPYVTFWVDAICINHSDVFEKNSQVQRMAEIFSGAHTVVTWLGPEEEDSDKAIDLIKLVCDREPLPNDEDFDLELAQLEFYIRPYDKPGHFSEHKAALQKLFERPYWSRIWTIQEVVLARQLIVMCGRQNLRWESCVRAGIELLGGVVTETTWHPVRSDDGKSLQPISRTSFPWDSMMARLDRLRRIGKLPLFDLLVATHELQSSNPRDRLYGMLGIASDGTSLVPSVNYHATPSQMWTDLTKQMMQANQSLNLILMKGYTVPKLPDLPSWVPDWTDIQSIGPLETHSLSSLTQAISYLEFKAAGDARPIVTFEGTVLKARGLFLDTIEGLSPVLPTDKSSDLLVEPCTTCKSPYGDDYRISKAIFKSLLAGIDASEVTSEVYSRLWTDEVSAIIRSHNPRFYAWLLETNKLLIRGKYLSEWCSIPFQSRLSITKLKNQVSRPRQLDRGQIEEAVDALASAASNHMRLMVTAGGWIGMAHSKARKGDMIGSLLGCDMPVVLRARGDSSCEVVGCAYVHKVMNGEGWKESKLQDIRLL